MLSKIEAFLVETSDSSKITFSIKQKGFLYFEIISFLIEKKNLCKYFIYSLIIIQQLIEQILISQVIQIQLKSKLGMKLDPRNLWIKLRLLPS